jgi:hypothetical protein
MKSKLTSIVSVIRDYMVVKPAGIIIMYMESVFENRADKSEKRFVLIPVQVKSR